MSIAIMSRFFKIEMGTCARKMLAVRLADFADDEGRGIWPTIGRLSRETELSERTVQRTMKEFVDEGLLVVVSEGGGRPGAATRYDFDMVVIDRMAATKKPAVGAPVAPETGAEVADGDGCHGVTPDTVARVTPATERGDMDDGEGCHHVTQTVRETIIESVTEREREGARGGKEGKEDDIRRLKIRVKAMEIGKVNKDGEALNPWPGIKGASTDWNTSQFKKLSPEERQLAEERRDAYLAVCKAEGIKPVPLGIYFRDRKFDLVTLGAARRATAKLERVAIKPFGPVWGGMVALCLADGPKNVEMPGDPWDAAERMHAQLSRVSQERARAYRERKGISLSPDGKLVFPEDFQRAEYRLLQCQDGYPLVKRLYGLASDYGRNELTDGKNQLLAEFCEPVPVGSAVYEAWKAHFHKMNWPLWPDPGKMAVIWLPKGGPEGMDVFSTAAKAAMREGEGHADAA